MSGFAADCIPRRRPILEWPAPGELAPKGIHVSHIVIDGGVRKATAGSVEGGDAADDSYLDPDAIAQSNMHVVNQHRSAWTWEIELRSWVEKF
ncbi:hypothetical protein JQ621_20050 [Bradyrhizobium manausense]|uniref:hypothetical protein n=1 Tax=Bradyrhizobium manausense TaxID=989370 RepID=UPI001BA6F370|nr:hypothetical protein [Bradyrhizobium manausense]